MTEPGPATIARRLRTQGVACAALGSPLYAALLARAAADAEEAGPVWEVLRGHVADPGPSALALRLLGQVHQLALRGEAPALAAHYPSTGGDGDAEAAWPALLDVLGTHRDWLRSRVGRPVQTNEVGRSAALLGGFLTVARETALPLRLLETGCSAGLNLRWDRYWYGGDGPSWGDPSSPVRFSNPWTSGRPPLDTEATVAERRGCDAHPVDPATEEGRLTLLSFIWPDQAERFRQVDAAIAVSAAVPAAIEQANGPDWLAARLAEPAPGLATVVFHSIVVQYFTPDDRIRFDSILERAGARAAAAAPLAHLAMELSGIECEVRLRTWPGGHERLLARCSPHGPPVAWLAGA